MLKQISVFLPNKPGILAEFTKVLLQNNINMRAISVADTADYGILRIIVDKVDDCIKILKTNNYLVSVTEVIAVEVPDKPGGLHQITKILGDVDVNIEYLYSTILKEKAIIVLRVDDIKKAANILKTKGLKLLDSMNS